MKRIVFILFVFFGLSVYAQDEPVYSHYMFNSISFNPAYAGNKDMLHIQSTYRMQWLGIDGSPRTIQASLDAPIYKSMSAGLEVLQDKVGDFSTNKIYGSYAYRINVNSESRISFGIAGGVEMRNIERDENSINDPIYNNIVLYKNIFNARAGVYYSATNFYVGVSATSLISNENYFNSNKINPYRNYFLTAGYLLKLGENTVIYPSILYKDDFNKNSLVNATTLIGYKSIIWAGISYRSGFNTFSSTKSDFDNSTSKVMGILVDFELNDKFRLGYNYDYSLSYLNNYENGSHEFSISYYLKSKKSNRMLNPRYL